MSIEGILVGLLAIAIGAAWAFYGLKLFTILLPIWAFFFGSLLHHGVVGTVAFILIGGAGLIYQMRDDGQTITSIDRSAYGY